MESASRFFVVRISSLASASSGRSSHQLAVHSGGERVLGQPPAIDLATSRALSRRHCCRLPSGRVMLISLISAWNFSVTYSGVRASPAAGLRPASRRRQRRATIAVLKL